METSKTPESPCFCSPHDRHRCIDPLFALSLFPISITSQLLSFWLKSLPGIPLTSTSNQHDEILCLPSLTIASSFCTSSSHFNFSNSKISNPQHFSISFSWIQELLSRIQEDPSPKDDFDEEGGLNLQRGSQDRKIAKAGKESYNFGKSKRWSCSWKL